jgi:predicted O-methyltransferase YrrM
MERNMHEPQRKYIMNRYGKNLFYGWAWRFQLRRLAAEDIAFLGTAYPKRVSTQQIKNDLEQFDAELKAFDAMRLKVENHRHLMQTDFESLIFSGWFELFYALVRIKQPKIVIETGCASGTTSALILYALEKNARGHLHSIDIRFENDFIRRNGLQTGFLIPDSLKQRWSFIEQDLKTALPRVLAEQKQVDFFYHDSDHNYLHQMWEYLTAWRYLSIGGVLCSDDLRHNTAFFDFARQVPERLNVTMRNKNFGYMIRTEAYDLSHASMG